MAKPFRRKKRGKYVGNFFVSVGKGAHARDVNLETKDAAEAHRRARLAMRGEWPPEEIAAKTIAAAADPANDHEAPGLADPPGVLGGGGPHAGSGSPVTSPPPPSAVITPEASAPAAPAAPAEPLASAIAGAAAEAAGASQGEKVEAPTIAAESAVQAELDAIMSELSGGAPGGADLLDGVCDGVAAGLLWAERKALEYGINWTLARRKDDRRIVTQNVPEGSLMRKSLKVGLKGAALLYFPDFALKLTPGWAIAVGMIGGGGQALLSASWVKVDDKGNVVAQVSPDGAPVSPPAPAPQPSA